MLYAYGPRSIWLYWIAAPLCFTVGRNVTRAPPFPEELGGRVTNNRTNGLYLDWIGHSPCNDGYVFAMLNVRLQNHANLATMITYCGAACIGGFELSPLLHLHIYLSAHSIITQNTTTPCNDIIKHVCINCIGLQ